MIIPLWIDTEGIVEQFTSITSEQIDTMLDNLAKGLAAGYARQLEEEAQKALHSTRQRYISNIKLVDSGKLEGTVLLDYSKDPLIRMIEEGADAFDEKEGFFKSEKVKLTKDNRRYLTIPFRWATPGAIAESSVFSGVLPSGVYNVVRKKTTDIPMEGGGMRSKGLTIDEIPGKFQTPSIRSATQNSNETLQMYGVGAFKEYQHRSSLYAGLVKMQDSVTNQNRYMTFRRVSEPGVNDKNEPVGSDPNSWIHPGMPSQDRNLIEVALANFNTEAELTNGINIELAKLGFDVSED